MLVIDQNGMSSFVENLRNGYACFVIRFSAYLAELVYRKMSKYFQMGISYLDVVTTSSTASKPRISIK
jgi:hypothetical protein